MCKAKLVAEQVHAAQEREKAAIHDWFIDIVCTNMVKERKTSTEFQLSELEEMYENRGYILATSGITEALHKEGFYTNQLTDYEGNVSGVEIIIQPEYLYKV